MGKYEDHIHYSAAQGADMVGSLDSLFFDETKSSSKGLVKVTFGMPPEIYDAVQAVIHHKDLGFQGNMSDYLRHTTCVGTEPLDKFMGEEIRTMFRAFMAQQRRLGRERLIATIEELIQQQAEALQFWTDKGKWTPIVRGINAFLGEVKDYPQFEWREHAAQEWLAHPDIKKLLRLWGERMNDEAPKAWQDVKRLFEKWEEMAGV